MRTFSLSVLLLTGCATTATLASEPASDSPSATERACLDALTLNGSRLDSAEFTACERDLDCRGVSALLSGRCGAVVNARVFDSHLTEFAQQTATCDPVLQLVPRCPHLRPVCRAHVCAEEAVAELPDECAEQRAALIASADTANRCELDAQCTVLEDRPTSVEFAASSLDQQEHLAQACGTVPPKLFLVRPETTEAFCVSGRCVSEKASPQFTTVVRDRHAFTRPEFDSTCLKDQFLASFTNEDWIRRQREWLLSYWVNLDANGHQNQFEFLVPANLSLAAQRSFAARLGTCRAKPALYRGKPMAIRHRVTIKWIVK